MDERERTILHELGNAIAIARANLEGVADGVLEATPERIETILATLAESGELIEKLRRGGDA